MRIPIHCLYDRVTHRFFRLVSLSELDISANDLEEIPPTIGLLRHLRTLIADENFLSDIPCELGSCSGLTVVSGEFMMLRRLN